MDESWLQELSSFLRIPSVSADPAHAEDVRRAAGWVRDFVLGAGGDAEVVEPAGHPLALGRIPASTGEDAGDREDSSHDAPFPIGLDKQLRWHHLNAAGTAFIAAAPCGRGRDGAG